MTCKSPSRTAKLPSVLRHTLFVTLAVLAAMALLPNVAHADLNVCNQTPNTVSISFGYRASAGWQSQGWWVTGPGACATVYQGPLETRYYYLHAVDDFAGGAWDGTVYMCTQDASFTIFGVEDCLARGYERTGFYELDTGDNTEWTVQLTETNINLDPQ
jgi:uncharacterized membrane protein